MTKKMTMLDALSTLDVTVDILRMRADHWEIVATHHTKIGRTAQADRLTAAVKTMRKEATRLEREEKAAAKAEKIALAAAAPARKSRRKDVELVA